MSKVGEVVGVLLIGLVIVSVIGAGGGGNATGSQDTALGILGGSQSIQVGFGQTVESVSDVSTSLNDSLALTGANDSNVTVEGSFGLGTDFSMCTYAEANSSVVTNDETRLLMATEGGILWYNGTDDAWHGYYYNISSRNSYRASVTATSPSTPTLVCLNHGAGTLNVTANTTIGTNVTATGSNIAVYPENVSNWHGEVEETRLYGTPLNHSQRTEWVGEPVLALQGATPAARVTYDTRATSTPSSFDAYFGDGSASVSNASLATGRGGPAIAAGSDYSVGGATVTILTGGQLDPSGEVLYLSYGLGGGLGTEIARLAMFLMVLVGLAVLVERSM